MDATSRADLHVHSKFSDRPSEWILRRVGAPESFVEPLHVYRTAKERGMRFVTLSDHNCIDGALEIADLPDTFISNEVTTYFPEDGCKIHCLVVGITPAQFQAIQELRSNIYEFHRYVVEQDIIASVAHPLFQVNDRMTPEHLERLIVLFNRFEGINGSRDGRAGDIANAILRHLTPDLLEQMADKHGLTPVGDEPWQKTFTGGSDDHGGVYIASAYTVTPPADTVAQFLQHIREGRHEMGGRTGNSLRLAHSFYHIAYSYYRARIVGGSTTRNNLIGELLKRFLDEPAPAPRSTFGGIGGFVRRVVQKTRTRKLSPADRTIVHELGRLFGDQPPSNAVASDSAFTDDQRTFQLAARVCHQLTCSFMGKFVEQISRGDLLESLQAFASLGPVALSIAPYLAAFKTQHKDERFLQQITEHFNAASHLQRRSDRRAWITDTFTDVNGVARMVQCLGGQARKQGRELTVLTCLPETPWSLIDLKNFQPVGEFNLPEYEFQKLAFPPFLDVIEHIERQRYGELIISTPGPLGLTALAAGRLMGLRLTGIYHTDFPSYVRHMTEDANLEHLTWQYMHWFFDQMHTVFVPSACYRDRLIDVGIDASKLAILPRGIDVERFNPAKRDAGFFSRFGLKAGVKFLYVGRVSVEKNLEPMLEAFNEVLQRGIDAELVVVGDGPALHDLRGRYGDRRVVFTGFLQNEELAKAFASADVFVFPSTTDTFGQAVLEAQASGLPAIVTDRGGPQEIVEHGRSGLVVDLGRPHAWADAMRSSPATRACAAAWVRRP
jgi:glycosyltransferase involved in cell wall biosynthesis